MEKHYKLLHVWGKIINYYILWKKNSITIITLVLTKTIYYIILKNAHMQIYSPASNEFENIGEN